MRSSGERVRGPFGLPRLHLRIIDSTNQRAKALGERGAPHGTLVTADEQTAGRGRQGRRWVAPPGTALLASVVVRPLDEHDTLLPLAAAVAVCDACEAAAGAACEIKWPNDVWIENRKVAGILIEGRPQERWAVVGVGINVTARETDFPAELRATATSLAAAPKPPRDSEAVLPALLAALGRCLDAQPAAVLRAWQDRDALAGREVRWDGGFGRAAGVNERGELLVDTADGQVALDAGEVHLAP